MGKILHCFKWSLAYNKRGLLKHINEGNIMSRIASTLALRTIASLFILILLMPILDSLLGFNFFAALVWQNQPFHSILEGMGGFIALIISAILTTTNRLQLTFPKHAWIAGALIGMGTLDIFHASIHIGNTFIWLHSIATFLGGLLFTLVWIPENKLANIRKIWPIACLIFSIVIGAASLIFSEFLPLMKNGLEFSFLARALNICGGIFMFVAATYLLKSNFKNNRKSDLTFAIHCTLFGASGILFELSTLWDATWWTWHALRFAAYLVVLIFAIDQHKQTVRISEGQRISNIFKVSVGLLPIGMVIMDEQARIILANPQFEKILGHDSKNLLGIKIFEVIPELSNFFDEEQQRSIQIDTHTAKGESINLEVLISATNDVDSRFHIMTVQDITTRVEMENNLAQRTEALKLQTQQALEAMEQVKINLKKAEIAEMEIKYKAEEMSSFNKIAVDREIRMIELKKEVNKYAQMLGKDKPYEMDLFELDDQNIPDLENG